MYKCCSVCSRLMDLTLSLCQGLIGVKGRQGWENFTYLSKASLAATEMHTLWQKRISHRVFFPCLGSNSSPYYNQQEVESGRKVIGLQRQCIYNYNAYLVTMLKQRPPSLHAREHSFPPSHSHDVIIASSHGCTVFSSSSSLM